jgi:hypothetical protein
VLTAVRLDDQPVLKANEVEDVAVERDLALELQAPKAIATEDCPELAFSVR